MADNEDTSQKHVVPKAAGPQKCKKFTGQNMKQESTSSSMGRIRRKKVKGKRKTRLDDKYEMSDAVVGRGTFGTVYKAKCKRTGRHVAVKKVKLDLRYRNRELQMIAMVKHQNVVQLIETFSRYDDFGNFWIHIVMEYMHKNLYQAVREYKWQRRHMPITVAKLYAYQILRGVAYIHSLGIVHRDLKPQNILVNTDTGEVKLCDFGSAKIPSKDEQSVSYIGSRYYRAPELIYESTEYRQGIDVWATACVIAEMLLAEPIFVGENNDDLLTNITDVLGKPTRRQVFEMSRDWSRTGKWKNYVLNEKKAEKDFLKEQYGAEKYDDGQPIPDGFIDMLRRLFRYVPAEREHPLVAMSHEWFDELREPDFDMLDLDENPPLYDWTEMEEMEAKEHNIWSKLQVFPEEEDSVITDEQPASEGIVQPSFQPGAAKAPTHEE